MPVTVEARRLSGVDLGKTVRLPDGDTGILVSVSHVLGATSLTIEIDDLPNRLGRHTLHTSPTATVTIAGRNP